MCGVCVSVSCVLFFVLFMLLVVFSLVVLFVVCAGSYTHLTLPTKRVG